MSYSDERPAVWDDLHPDLQLETFRRLPCVDRRVACHSGLFPSMICADRTLPENLECVDTIQKTRWDVFRVILDHNKNVLTRKLNRWLSNSHRMPEADVRLDFLEGDWFYEDAHGIYVDTEKLTSEMAVMDTAELERYFRMLEEKIFQGSFAQNLFDIMSLRDPFLLTMLDDQDRATLINFRKNARDLKSVMIRLSDAANFSPQKPWYDSVDIGCIAVLHWCFPGFTERADPEAIDDLYEEMAGFDFAFSDEDSHAEYLERGSYFDEEEGDASEQNDIKSFKQSVTAMQRRYDILNVQDETGRTLIDRLVPMKKYGYKREVNKWVRFFQGLGARLGDGTSGENSNDREDETYDDSDDDQEDESYDESDEEGYSYSESESEDDYE